MKTCPCSKEPTKPTSVRFNHFVIKMVIEDFIFLTFIEKKEKVGKEVFKKLTRSYNLRIAFSYTKQQKNKGTILIYYPFISPNISISLHTQINSLLV